MSQSPQPDNPHLISKGVDQLIEKLRVDGVEAGQKQADAIIADARAQAKKIVQEAQQKAKQTMDEANKQARNYQSAAENALKTAMRDMVLELKGNLTNEFGRDVKRLIAEHVSQPELMREIILELVGRVGRASDIEHADEVTVVLPETVIGLDELRNAPDKLEQSPLTELVLGLTSGLLREGVVFANSDDFHGGLKIQLHKQNLQIDLTVEAVSELLLAHLQPRFRAILEGVIR
ncbi:HrpE/YscL family type III secretion apparatus protein [Aestuariibacter salexigens]|uniref:HrpE/YscL family type III secretion apparatus protein n=1 Tax=Aestuariibacter salexigens TaxID=226010 RepID=UPI0004241D54|nr:HrpE/YscL family type III secretion apparatus protein [Aestuariibacter salexigens]